MPEPDHSAVSASGKPSTSDGVPPPPNPPELRVESQDAPRQGAFVRRLTNPQELERAWFDVLAHYPKDHIPQDLRTFERKRGGNIQQLAGALRGRTFIPEPASLIFIRKPNHPDERRPITLIRPEDRIVLTALNRLLPPLFDRRFLGAFLRLSARSAALGPPSNVSPNVCARGLIHQPLAISTTSFPNIDRDHLLRDVKRTIFEQPILDLAGNLSSHGRRERFRVGRFGPRGRPGQPAVSSVFQYSADRLRPFSGTTGGGMGAAMPTISFCLGSAHVRDAFARAEAFLLENCGLSLNVQSRVVYVRK